MRRVSFALLLCVLGAGPALANADGDVLVKLGLVGRWAEHCDLPPAAENAHIVYEAPPDGPPTEQLIMASQDMDRRDPLSEVRVLDAGKVEWSQRSGDEMLVIVTLLEPTRLKTWSSVTKTGKVYIRDGAYSGEGGLAPWFNKCAVK